MGQKLRTLLKLSGLLAILMIGCTPAFRPATAPPQAPFFRPPTASTTGASQAGQPATTEVRVLPAPTIQCQNNLTFLSDLTIPDGSIVSPGSTLDKRWEVENSGNCNWNVNYRVRLTAGPELDARKEQALFPARAGTHAIIRILFKAPEQPGTYRSAWQAFNEQGEPFGDPFFIEITVVE